MPYKYITMFNVECSPFTCKFKFKYYYYWIASTLNIQHPFPSKRILILLLYYLFIEGENKISGIFAAIDLLR